MLKGVGSFRVDFTDVNIRFSDVQVYFHYRSKTLDIL
jgi:hypothetical protein